MTTFAVEPATVIRDENVVMREYTDQVLAFDLETTGLKHSRGRIAVICLRQEGKPPAVLHYPAGIPRRSKIIKFLQTKTLVGHNITAFDMPFMANAGYNLWDNAGWHDTMVLEQLIRPSDRRNVRMSLAATMKRHLNKEIDKDIDHSGWTREHLTHEQLTYASTDVYHLLDIFNKQMEQLTEAKLEDSWQLENDIAAVVSSMIHVGMPLNDEYRLEMLERAAAEATTRELDLANVFGKKINVRSPKQVREAFSEVLGVSLNSTSADVMQELSMRGGDVGLAAQLILETRQYAKTGMYDDRWVSRFVTNGRVHASYRSMGTDTGRFSSREPNFQQIPKKHRGMFATDDDHVLVWTDYNAIEVLVSGVLMREPRIVEAYTGGVDLHSYVAGMLFGKDPSDISYEERQTAKAASFTLLFAGGVPGLQRSASDYGVELTRPEALEIIKSFSQGFPKAQRFVNWARRYVDREMFIELRIPRGPRRVLTRHDAAPMSAPKIVNTLVQGTAAVGMKNSMRLLKERGLGDMVRATVHDELILECRKQDAEEVKAEVERAMKDGMHEIINVYPNVETSIGRSWGL